MAEFQYRSRLVPRQDRRDRYRRIPWRSPADGSDPGRIPRPSVRVFQSADGAHPRPLRSRLCPLIMQKILIIGATSGIGRELARLYASAGHRVGATGRRQELLDSLQAEYPDHILTANGDATAPDAALQLAALTQRLGGLDLLIFN